MVDSSNDCFDLVLKEVNSRLSGFDGRVTGMSRKFANFQTELDATMAQMDSFASTVSRTLDDANKLAIQTLNDTLESRIQEAVLPALARFEDELPKRVARVLVGYCTSCLEPLMLVAEAKCTRCTGDSSSRGRSRERFQVMQGTLIRRARTVSSQRELHSVISEAQSLASHERA